MKKEKKKKFVFKYIFCMVKTSISANTHETRGGGHQQYGQEDQHYSTSIYNQSDNVSLSPTRNKSHNLIVICN